MERLEKCGKKKISIRIMPIQGETRNCGQYNKDKNYAYPRRD